jgi:hypothetical protein
MDNRSARVARELADQGIDRRRGTSLFVVIAALLVALGIGLVRTAPSFASPRAASRGERDVAVRKHDEQGNESDVLVLRDDHGGDKDGAAMDRRRGHDHDHRGGKHHKHGGNGRHGGKGKHTGGHRGGPKGGTTHRTAGGKTGVNTKPGGTQVGGGHGGDGTKATGRTTGGGTTAVTGGTKDTTAATAVKTGGVTNPTAGGTGVGTRPTCNGDEGADTAPEPQTNPGDWQTNWED